MTKADKAQDPTSADLIANLGAIASPSELELINNYLNLAIDPAHQTDARQKAALRTQRYKLRKLLLREPSSQHILQACGYVVFARYAAKQPSPRPIVHEIQELLIAAGFDKDRTAEAMARFVMDAGERKTTWVARTRTGLQVAIFKALKDLRAADKDKSVTG